MTKKKICFVLPSHWSKYFGGVEYEVKTLLDELAKENDLTIYYVCRYSSPAFSTNKYEIIKIGEKSIYKEFRFYFDIFDLLKVLKKIDPDIIYQRVACVYTGICAYYAKKFGRKMIFHISLDTDIEPFKFSLSKGVLLNLIEKILLKYAIKNAQYIIGQSEYQNKLLQKNFGRRCDIIFLHIHPKPKNPIKKPVPIKALLIANFKKFKRPELFIKLAKEFQGNRNVEFLMVGRRNIKKKWQRKLEDKIFKLENIRYLGEKTIEEVNRLLCSSHVLVNTSLYEGFPNTFIHAWMRKVPVASLCANPNDILTSKNIGFHSGTFEQLVKDVEKLIKNRELRSDMGERAQKYAFKNHSIENNISNIDKIIKLFLK